MSNLNSASLTIVNATSPIKRWDWFSLILPLLALSQLLYPEATFLWGKEHMQFFPLAIVAAAWFFNQEGMSGLPLSKARKRSAIYMAVIGIFVCYIALFFFSSWLAHLACIVLTCAWALGKFANLSLVRIFGICGLLAVTLPPPFNWDRLIVRGLQSLSTSVSNLLMDITHILHVQSGNVIEIPSKSLFVEEACSGVDSQYALMAVAGTLLLVGRAGLVVSLITIVTVPIWAILGNLLRIYSVVIGLEFFGLDLSAGLKHTLLGLVTFSLAAWAHWSSVQFLNLMAYKFSPNSNLKIDEQTDVATSISSVAHEKNLEMVSKSSLLFPALMFTLTPMVFISFQAQESRLPIINNAINAMLPTENDLPKLSHGSERKSFYIENRDGNSVLGLHSRVWWYSNGDVKQLASLDLPFRGWHGLWGCYEASGWTNLGTTVKDAAIDGNRLESPYFETQLRNSDGTYALLQFSLFDVNGKPFIYEFESLTASVRSRWTRSVFHRGFEIVQGDTIPITFQFQLLSRSSEPPTDEQRQDYRKMFLEFRETIREKSMPAFRKMTNK